MKNIFKQETVHEVIERLHKLTATTAPAWGKMSAGQMLAHCNVAYEMVYDGTHKAPAPFVKLMLKWLVKNNVVNEKPYKRNGQTAPAFLIKDEKNFEQEKTRLINYIRKTMELGEASFDQKESLSFGKLSAVEWNNMFYKHLDHHLSQFGV